MRKKLTHWFDWSIDDLEKAHVYRLNNLDEFPVLQNLEVLEKKELDGKIYILRRIDLADDIPDLIKSMTPAGLLEFHEELTFDIESRTEKFEIFPEKYRHKFHIKGNSRYVESKPQKTFRETDYQVTLNLMFLGTLKGLIAKNYSDGMDRDHEELTKLLQAGHYIANP